MPQDQRERAIVTIQEELEWWKKELEKQGKFVEAQRVTQRTLFDIEMMRTIGYCHGIENYSRHLSGRLPGEAPPTLLDYVPQDYLLFIDEAHQTVPQVRGMPKFGLMHLLACFTLFDGQPQLVNSILDGFLTVTKEQVQSVARTYLKPANRAIVFRAPAATSKEAA